MASCAKLNSLSASRIVTMLLYKHSGQPSTPASIVTLGKHKRFRGRFGSVGTGVIR